MIWCASYFERKWRKKERKKAAGVQEARTQGPKVSLEREREVQLAGSFKVGLDRERERERGANQNIAKLNKINQSNF